MNSNNGIGFNHPTIEQQIQEYVDIKVLPYMMDLYDQSLHIEDLDERRSFSNTVLQIFDFILTDSKCNVDKKLVLAVHFLGFFEKYSSIKKNFFALYDILNSAPSNLKDYPFMYFRDGKLTPAIVSSKDLPLIISDKEESSFIEIITKIQHMMKDCALSKIKDIISSIHHSQTHNDLTVFHDNKQINKK